MPNTNFWIASSAVTDGVFQMTGHNRSNHLFEILARKYIPNGPVDFDNQNWDEGAFLVWDGDDLWLVEVTLSSPEPNTKSNFEVIPDIDFRYDEYGLSPIVFSQITGAIVANL